MLLITISRDDMLKTRNNPIGVIVVDTKKKEWEEAYKNRDNIVFYPDEEVVRSVAVHIKKRIGLDEFIVRREIETVLDLGCGFGRHVKFLDEMGFKVFGTDLSEIAIELAKKWFVSIDKPYLAERLTACSATNLPYENESFDFVLCYGMLDCMSFDIAKQSMDEATRVLKKGGFLHIDLYSDNFEETSKHGYEVVAEPGTATGTVRSYFDNEKIDLLLGGRYETVDGYLLLKKSLINNTERYRRCLDLEKI